MLVELCFGTLLFLICFFWVFTALNSVVFQIVTSNQQNIKKNVTEKSRRWRAWEVMLGLFGLLFMLYAYNFFFGENGYRRQKQEALKIEYGEKRMLWRMSEKMTEQQMLTDMEIKLNKTYPAKGKSSEKEFEEWKEEHSERRWLTLPGMS